MARIALPRCGKGCKGYCTHLRKMSLVLVVFALRTMYQVREVRRLRLENKDG